MLLSITQTRPDDTLISTATHQVTSGNQVLRLVRQAWDSFTLLDPKSSKEWLRNQEVVDPEGAKLTVVLEY